MTRRRCSTSDFAGETWLRYVPIRVPDTICVQERLPPGAAGVLINQTHTYRDLYLPITASEKRLFDAIDGNRSIGDIVEKALQSSRRSHLLDAARTFSNGSGAMTKWCSMSRQHDQTLAT